MQLHTHPFIAGLVTATLIATPVLSRAAALTSTSSNREVDILQHIELYGALRLSVDYQDSDVGRQEADADPLLSDGDISLSSNTSTIGFRGAIPINDRYRALWQYDQQVDIDDTDSGDVWTTRDSFLGVEGPYGAFLIGRANTPFKNMATVFMDYLNTTVGDPHAIFGVLSSDSHERLDKKSANALTWRYSGERFSMQAQFAADQAGSIRSVDDNDHAAYSVWARWRPGALDLNAAWIKYAEFTDVGDIDAYRLSGKYSLGAATLGVLYEDINIDGGKATPDRSSYGIQLKYRMLPRWSLLTQWNHARETSIGDDQADQYSVALLHPVNAQLLLHVAYTMTRNGDNATYRGVDFAHGDRLETLPGRNPQALSVGAQLLF